jgi:hypothetical protein
MVVVATVGIPDGSGEFTIDGHVPQPRSVSHKPQLHLQLGYRHTCCYYSYSVVQLAGFRRVWAPACACGDGPMWKRHQTEYTQQPQQPPKRLSSWMDPLPFRSRPVCSPVQIDVFERLKNCEHEWVSWNMVVAREAIGPEPSFCSRVHLLRQTRD